MFNADSYDWRRKAIDPIELDGMNNTQATQVFHISRNTIELWLKGKADTADDRAKSYPPPRNG